MAKGLTTAGIEALKPGAARREIPDGGKNGGLYFIMQPSGAASWAYRYRFDGRARKLTLGPFPALGLAAARAMAKQAAADVAKGKDPGAEKVAARVAAKAKIAEAKAAEVERPDDLVEDVAKLFLKRPARNKRERRPRTVREIERIMASDILPKWGKRQFSTITKREATAHIESIADRDAPVMANRTLSVLKAMANFAVRRGILSSNVFATIDSPAAETPRDRKLEDEEIGALMMALKSEDFPLRPLVTLLLLTGQRRSEIAEMKWSEVDLAAKVWTLPKERAKNGREHALPLPDDVVDILRETPRIDSSDLVFTANGVNAFTAFDTARNRLHAKMEATLGEPVKPWRLHDLRRTCASAMASLGIAPHVVEAVLNHKSGTIRGVASVYNKYNYRGEMLAALTAWSRRLREIETCEPAASNVVPLKAV